MLTSFDLTIWGLLIVVPIVVVTIRKRQSGTVPALAMMALGVYGAVLTGLVFGGIPLDPELLEDLQHQSDPVSLWVPFQSTIAVIRYSPRTAAFLIGGNILLMLPAGYLLPLASSRFRALRNVLVLGLVTSLAVEVIQLGASHLLEYDYRVFEVDDVLLNALGISLGWALWRHFHGPRGQ